MTLMYQVERSQIQDLLGPVYTVNRNDSEWDVKYLYSIWNLPADTTAVDSYSTKDRWCCTSDQYRQIKQICVTLNEAMAGNLRRYWS